ncbi:MAG: hypothetical protein U0637_13985 [Phycisphaerales bacterium]
MDTAISYISAVVATLMGLAAPLLLGVLLIAGAANSSEQQLTRMKAWAIAIAVVTLLGVGCAVWLMIARRPWTAVACGGFPALFCLVAFLIMLRWQN